MVLGRGEADAKAGIFGNNKYMKKCLTSMLLSFMKQDIFCPSDWQKFFKLIIFRICGSAIHL